MGIGAINSINPFNKAYGASLYAPAVNPVSSASIFGQNNNNNSSKIDSNQSIFDTKIDFNPKTSSVNPFASVNKVNPFAGIAPTHAKENYRNGLAPSSDLQGVYAGMLNGKANILNQIAIA